MPKFAKGDYVLIMRPHKSGALQSGTVMEVASGPQERYSVETWPEEAEGLTELLTDVPPDQLEPHGWTPLVRAIFNDDTEAVIQAVAAGADPNGILAIANMVWLATFHGQPNALAALINSGAKVPADALTALGEDEITDHMINGPEDEQRYARVAQILLDHGANPGVLAYDSKPLIESFFEGSPIHRVLTKGGKGNTPVIVRK